MSRITDCEATVGVGSSPTVSDPRYEVEAVMWGYRRRFVVRDRTTDRIIAIRTTSDIASGDLLRLNMANFAGRAPRPIAPILVEDKG